MIRTSVGFGHKKRRSKEKTHETDMAMSRTGTCADISMVPCLDVIHTNVELLATKRLGREPCNVLDRLQEIDCDRLLVLAFGLIQSLDCKEIMLFEYLNKCSKMFKRQEKVTTCPYSALQARWVWTYRALEEVKVMLFNSDRLKLMATMVRKWIYFIPDVPIMSLLHTRLMQVSSNFIVISLFSFAEAIKPPEIRVLRAEDRRQANASGSHLIFLVFSSPRRPLLFSSFYLHTHNTLLHLRVVGFIQSFFVNIRSLLANRFRTTLLSPHDLHQKI